MTNQQNDTKHVLVKTSARIHMGFFDLNGQSGRRFGSMGLSLNVPNTVIELAVGNHVFGEAPEPAYVQKSKRALLEAMNIDSPISLLVHEQIPRHAGLGSGTQMALAIGAGINKLLGLNLSLAEIAIMTGRGLRSGVGIGTFEQGGLVVDGGRGAQTKVPPIIARHPFPEPWRVLLVFDPAHKGVHGEQEIKAFKTLEDACLSDTRQNGHAILMQALPALIEHNLTQFGQAISQLQAYTGHYFSPAQGGQYASQSVAEVLNYLTLHGIHCVGQTSWGPTGFAVFEDDASAQYYVNQLARQFPDSRLEWKICSALNSGASVHEML